MAIPKAITYKGVEYRSQRAAALANGIHPSAFRYQLNPKGEQAKVRRWHSENREKSRALRRRLVGLPTPTRPCPAVCEICSRPPKSRALNLDHDHLTDVFRGWLCGSCNTAIGLLQDSPRIVRRVLAYLETGVAP